MLLVPGDGGQGGLLRRAGAGLARELRPMIRLAGPVVLAELGWMAMGIVDTICVGHLPDAATAISGVGLGHALFFGSTIVGLGLLLGLDTLISHAHGAGMPADCRAWLRHGVYLGLAVCPPLMALAWLVGGRLEAIGIDPAIRPGARAYLDVVTWSLPPLLVYFCLRRYLQARDRVGAVVFALVSANGVNVLANYALIFGHLGSPRLGVAGAAWATVISRSWMMLVLLAAVVRDDLREGPAAWRGGWRPERRRLRSARRARDAGGRPAPAGDGRLRHGDDPDRPARPVEPGGPPDRHERGEPDVHGPARRQLGRGRAGRPGDRAEGPGRRRRGPGWSALALGAAFMASASVVLVLVPRPILSGFTDQGDVIAAGVLLLYAAAVFQLFDGVQVVATGVLRGSGDTRTPMLANLVAYWAIGLPVGVTLCFARGWGVFGMWVGLTLGLILVGLALLAAWARRVAVLTSPEPAEATAAA